MEARVAGQTQALAVNVTWRFAFERRVAAPVRWCPWRPASRIRQATGFGASIKLAATVTWARQRKSTPQWFPAAQPLNQRGRAAGRAERQMGVSAPRRWQRAVCAIAAAGGRISGRVHGWHVVGLEGGAASSCNGQGGRGKARAGGRGRGRGREALGGRERERGEMQAEAGGCSASATGRVWRVGTQSGWRSARRAQMVDADNANCALDVRAVFDSRGLSP